MTTAAAEPPGSGPWQTATVIRVRQETPTAKTFTLKLPEPRPFWAGLHFIVRLTARGGYRAQRSSSIAAAPSDSPEVDLTIEISPGVESLRLPLRGCRCERDGQLTVHGTN